MKFSFICASNDELKYNENVKSSLEKQETKNFEVIIVDTSSQQFQSAAAALNYGAQQATGEYFVFHHNDVVFEDVKFTQKLAEYVDQNEFIIAGVAGAVKKSAITKNIVTNIYHGNDRLEINSEYCDKACDLDTIDECFFVIPKTIFNIRPFADFGNIWHFYSVEYSLWAKEIDASSVKLIPLKLWHKSKGDVITADYYEKIWDLRNRYKKSIFTTVGVWPYNRILLSCMIKMHRKKYAK